jgi:hypothetical protein
VIQGSIGRFEKFLLGSRGQIERGDPVRRIGAVVSDVLLDKNDRPVGREAPRGAEFTNLLRLSTRGWNHEAAGEGLSPYPFAGFAVTLKNDLRSVG